MKNPLVELRPQNVPLGDGQGAVPDVLQLLVSRTFSADDLPSLPATQTGAGWWAVGGAAALGIGAVILGAVALSLAGILLSDQDRR